MRVIQAILDLPGLKAFSVFSRALASVTAARTLRLIENVRKEIGVPGGLIVTAHHTERHLLWSSRPSLLVIVSSVLDILIIGTFALGGVLMAPLAPSIVASILAAAIVLALIMDQVKVWLFAHFKMV